MLLGIGVTEESPGISELRVAPHQPIPVLDADSNRAIGWLGNISSTGLMIRSTDSFAYRRVHEVRIVLSANESDALQVGIQLIWSKTDEAGNIASGFVIQRIASHTRAQLQHWISQHRHEHAHRSAQLPRVPALLHGA